MFHVEQTTTVEDDLLLAVLVKGDLERVVLHDDLKGGAFQAISRAGLVFPDEPSDASRCAQGRVAHESPRSCFVVVSLQAGDFVHLDTYDTIFVCSDLEGELDVWVYGGLDDGGEEGVGGVAKDGGGVDVVRGLPGLGSVCTCRESTTAATKAGLVARLERVALECERRRRREQRDEHRQRPHCWRQRNTARHTYMA